MEFKELREALAADASERVIWLASSTVASLLAALDAAEARLRAVCQTAVAAVGADGPCNAEDAVTRLVADLDAAQARVRRLEAALERLADGVCGTPSGAGCDMECRDIARAALADGADKDGGK